MASPTNRSGGEFEDLPEDLVPMKHAAALVYEHVYRDSAHVDQEIALNVLAQALCDLSPVHTYDERKKRFRALGSFELAGGVFTGGAEKLSFPDRRPPFMRIAIRASDVRTVIQTLIESGMSFEDIHAPRGAKEPPAKA